FAGVDIVRWRELHRPLIERAAFLIAPSRWAADTLARYYPGARVEVVSHGVPESTPRHAGTRLAVMLPGASVLTDAVPGAVGQDEGSCRLDKIGEDARDRGDRVR